MARTTAFGFATFAPLLALLAGCPSTSNGPFFETPDAAEPDATQPDAIAPDAVAPDASGPAACAAAGGQCLVGDASCMVMGFQNCNPDQGPSGAFCCLDNAIDPEAGSCTDGGIQASSYDQSCVTDKDCVSVAEGDSCRLCGFECPGSAINADAQAKYQADIARTPAGLSLQSPYCVTGCPAGFAPCCRAGVCHADLQCATPATDDAGTDASIDAGTDASTDAGTDATTDASDAGDH
jgi:hypothetical protein